MSSDFTGSGTSPDPRRDLIRDVIWNYHGAEPGEEWTVLADEIVAALRADRLAARVTELETALAFYADPGTYLFDENGLTARDSEPTKGG